MDLLVGGGLVVILALSVWRPSAWCVKLCPLGATQDMAADVRIPMWEVFLSKPTMKHVVYCFLISIIIPAIGAFIPAFRAQKKSIVDTLYFIK